MIKRYLRFTILWLVITANCFAAPALPQENNPFEISLLPTGDDSFTLIEENFKQQLYLEKITVDCDVAFGRDEFLYLTQLKENNMVSASELKAACWYLKRKNKFDSVVISIEPISSECIDTENAYEKVNITFSLKARWTFSKLKFKGSILDKEQFSQFYLLESGESFILEKHQHSMEKITQELQNQGYLNAILTDYIAYDKEFKTVSVILDLSKTERFTVDDVSIAINFADQSDNDGHALATKAKNRIEGELKNSYYTKSGIENSVEVLKKYLAHKGYFNSLVKSHVTFNKENCRVQLTFDITLRHKKRFVFFGNHFFTTEQLLDEILVIGSSALLIPPQLLSEDIVALYKKKGFWNCTVEWREEQSRFFLLIKENSRVKVSSVVCEAVTALDTPEVLKRHFCEFCGQQYFDEGALSKAIDNLTMHYIAQGYWDFKISKKDYIKLADDNYELVLTVTPGLQRKLVSLTIPGYQILEKEEPFSKWINLKEPVPFNLEIVQEQRQWLIKYFQQKGFLFVHIHPKLIEQENGQLLEWHIDSKPQIVFGKTIIEGCSRIDSNILLRELDYKEGEPFNKKQVDSTLANLKALNIFDSVSLVPHNLTNTDSSKTMVLKFLEDYPYEIRTRFGFQQVSKNFTRGGGTTYKLGGSFLWKNPSGQADMLRLDADITRYTRHVSAQYELPWLFEQPIRTQFKIYSTVIEQPIVVGSSDRLYQVSSNGFLANFSRQFSCNQVNLITGFDWMKISGLSSRLAKTIEFKPELVNKYFPYFVCEPSITLDYLDNKFNPSYGSLTFISAKGMFAMNVKKGSFIKLLLEQSFFYPLYSKSVIAALRLRAGYIFNQQFSTIMPTERFYLGGSNSLRGYEPDMAPPLNSFTGSNNCVYWVPIGGKSMININAEIRFGIWKQLSGVIFNDIGIVSAGGIAELKDDVLKSKFLGTTGFGLRYDTPIAPIRFDIGFKWRKRHKDDRRYAWYLTLGHAF